MWPAEAERPVALLESRLQACREHVAAHCHPLTIHDLPAVSLFLSVGENGQRAHVLHAVAANFDAAWRLLISGFEQACKSSDTAARWAHFRIDWVVGIRTMTLGSFAKLAAKVRRGHFRYGIAFDDAFAIALTEQELNANGVLVADDQKACAELNRVALQRYARHRFGRLPVPVLDDTQRKLHVLTLEGLYCDPYGELHRLLPRGPDTGRREVAQLDTDRVGDMLGSVASFLSRCVRANGRIGGGYLARTGRELEAPTVRAQASALHALVEAWALSRDESLRSTIEPALDGLVTRGVRSFRLAFGQTVSYLVEPSGHITLAGNAMGILALVRLCEATGERGHLPLLENLAAGMLCMQDAQTGRFDHVISARDLAVVDVFRHVEYDGEAIHALLKLYELTGESRWLSAAESAFDYVIDQRYWQHHSPWLSRAAGVLTRFRPLEKFFQFGVRNLPDFEATVRPGVPASPAMLELALAGRQLAERLALLPAMGHLLQQLDGERLYAAIEQLAHGLLNQFMWPEMAMYFAHPEAVAGTFFSRRDDFRASTGEADAAIRALVSYHAHLALRENTGGHPPTEGTGDDMHTPPASTMGLAKPTPIFKAMFERVSQPPGLQSGGAWTAEMVASATEGRWVVAPPEGWRVSGLALSADACSPNRMAVLRGATDSIGIGALALERLVPMSGALLTSDAAGVPAASVPVPVLEVGDTAMAVMRLGSYARSRFFGDVVGVTGSVGKTTMVAMLAEALRPLGGAGHTHSQTSMPLGIAADMASMPQDAPCWVIEMAVDSMLLNAQLARPTVAIVTSVAPAHLSHYGTVERIARKKSAIFGHMRLGGHAVLRRDMPHYRVVERAAQARGLHVISYGDHDEADVSLMVAGNGQVRAVVQGEEVSFQLALPGRHMAVNALGVIATLLALELPLDAALQQFAHMQPLPGRGQRFGAALQSGGQATVIDDAGSASPESMKAALALLAQAPCAPSQRVAVLGDMLDLGVEAQRYHLELEQDLLEAAAGRVFLYGSLMRALHLSLIHI